MQAANASRSPFAPLEGTKGVPRNGGHKYINNDNNKQSTTRINKRTAIRGLEGIKGVLRGVPRNGGRKLTTT